MTFDGSRRRVVRTACVCMLLLSCAWDIAAAEDGAGPRTRSPGRRNMFFPVGRVPSAPQEEPPAAPEPVESEFTLLGTVVSGDRAGALVRFAENGGSVWLRQGDVAGSLRVEEVRPNAVLLSRGEEGMLLAVGKSSGELRGVTRSLAGAFELLGVCGSAESRFALVRLRQGGRVRRLNVNDRVGGGVVSAIDHDGIVLSRGPDTHSVPVGARYPRGFAIQ